jgi:hypothetical protein
VVTNRWDVVANLLGCGGPFVEMWRPSGGDVDVVVKTVMSREEGDMETWQNLAPSEELFSG